MPMHLTDFARICATCCCRRQPAEITNGGSIAALQWYGCQGRYAKACRRHECARTSQ